MPCVNVIDLRCSHESVWPQEKGDSATPDPGCCRSCIQARGWGGGHVSGLGPASLFNGCRDRESLVTCSDPRVRVFSCCFQGAVSLQGNKQPANLMATDPLIDVQV